MSAASTINLPGVTHPDATLVLLMIASATCGGPGIDAAGAARASAAVDQVLGAATARGFRDADIFRELVRRQRQGLVGKLADDAIGGSNMAHGKSTLRWLAACVQRSAKARRPRRSMACGC